MSRNVINSDYFDHMDGAFMIDVSELVGDHGVDDFYSLDLECDRGIERFDFTQARRDAEGEVLFWVLENARADRCIVIYND